ncbi:MAG TPA: FAD-dependent oxidoreductase [Solirubrobacterales bacterium]|nr:FAD-dependent oxidoreductase [Solirubrobacterales bacterium]
MTGDGVLIVGGGLASQRAIETLRARGYEGRIQLVCGEAELPYDRPPLSKGLLSGRTHESEIGFRSARWYADQQVELILGHRATALDEKRRRVRLDDGRELAYEALLIATGGAPRILPSLARYSNVRFLRTLADARRLRDELREGARLTIVGAGFIGQEVAATARAACAQVTLVEALPAPLGSLLGDGIGRWLMRMHAEEGVDVRLSTRLEGARGNGTVEELRLSDGRTLACDTVVVGIGVAPAASWLAGSRLGTDGVITDQRGRTVVPDVFAAGDVTRRFDPRVGEHRRSEHWDAAARQGAAAAGAMLGERPDPAPAPSFWSDQYGLRIQYTGYADHSDEATLEGDLDERCFSVVYTREGRPVGALTVNDPRAYARLRREVEATFGQQNTEKEQR